MLVTTSPLSCTEAETAYRYRWHFYCIAIMWDHGINTCREMIWTWRTCSKIPNEMAEESRPLLSTYQTSWRVSCNLIESVDTSLSWSCPCSAPSASPATPLSPHWRSGQEPSRGEVSSISFSTSLQCSLLLTPKLSFHSNKTANYQPTKLCLSLGSLFKL